MPAGETAGAGEAAAGHGTKGFNGTWRRRTAAPELVKETAKRVPEQAKRNAEGGSWSCGVRPSGLTELAEADRQGCRSSGTRQGAALGVGPWKPPACGASPRRQALAAKPEGAGSAAH